MNTKYKLCRMFANILSILVMLAMAFPVTGAAYAEGSSPPKVGLIVTTTGIDDNSFNEMAYQGLLRAANDLGVDISTYEPQAQSEYDSLMQQCADENELCIVVGFEFRFSLPTIARANPEIKWGIIDWSYPDCWEGAVEGVDCGSFTEIPNILGLRFNEKQAGYLAGVLAGAMTTSNVVGAVGGMEVPPVVAFLEGYRNGAQCTNPAVNVLTTYTGTFSDPGLGATTAQEMIGQGVDVIFGAAGSTGDGAITYSAQNGHWAIGVDADQYLTVFGGGTVDGSDKMLSSAMKRVDNAVYQTIADFINEVFVSGTVLYDLATDGVGLAAFHEADGSISQEVKDRLETVRQGIIDGMVNIDACPWLIAFPENNAIEGWEWPEGATVTLTIDNAPSDFSRTATAAVTTWGDPRTYFRIDFGDAYDLKIGDEVTLTDEFSTTIAHTVQNLSVTNVDMNENTVAGTADIGAQLQVWSHQQSEPPVDVTAVDGTWMADLTEVFDIVPDSSGRSQITIDGNATAVDWGVPMIWADPLCDCVNGWNWGVGNDLALQVFDTEDHELRTSNQAYTESGAFWGLGEEGIDLQPGYRIVMSNGLTTKELILSNLAVKEMNPVANTISGVFDPALPLFVHSENEEPLNYEFKGDRWVATFDLSQPIDRFGEVYQPDEDGDKTGMGWDGIPSFMRYDIYAFDVVSENIQRITELDGTGEYDPSWSPNGKKIAHDVVYWDGSHGIFVTDVKTGVSTPLVGADDGGNDAAWSPNGQWIAFDRRWYGDPNIYVVPAVGGVPALVRSDAVTANWAPNSKRLVFQQPSDGSIWTAAVDGGKGGVTFITSNASEPAWSPDGNWIAYVAGGNIWKAPVNIQGKVLGDPIQVTHLSAWTVGGPTWSLDSQTIFFNGGAMDDFDIWNVSAMGGAPVWTVGALETGDYGPENARNSASIAYATNSPDGLAPRQWVAVYTHDAGAWSEGPHTYHFEAQWNSGSEITPEVAFNVSNEAPLYDGYVLLRGLALRANMGGECPALDPPNIRSDQPTLFHNGYVTDYPMTYAGAVAYFDSLSAQALWDTSEPVDLQRHEIIPYRAEEWPAYMCSFTTP